MYKHEKGWPMSPNLWQIYDNSSCDRTFPPSHKLQLVRYKWGTCGNLGGIQFSPYSFPHFVLFPFPGSFCNFSSFHISLSLSHPSDKLSLSALILSFSSISPPSSLSSEKVWVGWQAGQRVWIVMVTIRPVNVRSFSIKWQGRTGGQNPYEGCFGLQV